MLEYQRRGIIKSGAVGAKPVTADNEGELPIPENITEVMCVICDLYLSEDDQKNQRLSLLKCKQTYAACDCWSHSSCLRQWLSYDESGYKCPQDEEFVSGWACSIRSPDDYENWKIGKFPRDNTLPRNAFTHLFCGDSPTSVVIPPLPHGSKTNFGNAGLPLGVTIPNTVEELRDFNFSVPLPRNKLLNPKHYEGDLPIPEDFANVICVICKSYLSEEEMKNKNVTLLKCKQTYAACNCWCHYTCFPRWIRVLSKRTCPQDDEVVSWACNIRSKSAYENWKLEKFPNDIFRHAFNRLFLQDFTNVDIPPLLHRSQINSGNAGLPLGVTIPNTVEELRHLNFSVPQLRHNVLLNRADTNYLARLQCQLSKILVNSTLKRYRGQCVLTDKQKEDEAYTDAQLKMTEYQRLGIIRSSVFRKANATGRHDDLYLDDYLNEQCMICLYSMSDKEKDEGDPENYEPTLLKCKPTYAESKHWFHFLCLMCDLSDGNVRCCVCRGVATHFAKGIRSANDYENFEILPGARNVYKLHRSWFDGLFNEGDDVVVYHPLLDANLENDANNYLDYVSR